MNQQEFDNAVDERIKKILSQILDEIIPSLGQDGLAGESALSIMYGAVYKAYFDLEKSTN